MGSVGSVVPLPQFEKHCHICADTTDYKLARCQGCQKWFCTEHASKANLMYCEHCVADVAVIEETFQREEEHYDENTDTVTTIKTPPIKQISFAGADWTFVTEVIRKLSDEELKIQINVLRGAVNLMENELVQRRIRKIVVARDSAGNVISRKVTNTTTKKTTRSAKPVDLAALVEKCKKAGLTVDQMKVILGI